MFTSVSSRLLVVCLFVAAPAISFAPNAASPTQTPSSSAVSAQLISLRETFINQIKAEGFQPSLPSPTIVLDNPPSFGNYEDDKNILHIADWSALGPEQQGLFSRLATAQGGERTGEQIFDEGIHHWVFIHELSHWWQACQHKTGENHYAVEYGANRIAAAFWRLKDPSVLEHTARNMTNVYARMPNPVPEGQSAEKYFNENYNQLGPTPVYRWFQASMVLKIQTESPLPTLHDTLAHPVYP